MIRDSEVCRWRGQAEAEMVGKRISVEKHKWDGKISTREEAELLECDVAPLVWRISAGT